MVETKQDLLSDMTRLRACRPAIEWVAEHTSDDAETIWRSCPHVGWLIWYAGRRAPRTCAAFAHRCAHRAEAYAARTYRAVYASAARVAVAEARAAADVCRDEAVAYPAHYAASYATVAYAADDAARAAYVAYVAGIDLGGDVDHERDVQRSDLHDMWAKMREEAQ